MAPKARIYVMERGFELVFLLCRRHFTAKVAAGWSVKSAKDQPHNMPCEDCPS